MELRQLRHFLAVLEHGSFIRAAEAVHLTQPALSRSIQALEAEVGATVLERSRGGMTTTEIGRLLLAHARNLDLATRELERDIALTKGLEMGELRIGVGPYGGSALVGPVIGKLNRLHPRLKVKAILAPWQELPDRVRARDVDLIVVEMSQVQNESDFAVQQLSEHSMLSVCRPEHPLTRMAHPTIADVFSYPTAGPSTTPAMVEAMMAKLPPTLIEHLGRNGLVDLECDLSGMLKDVLKNCDAIALMPAFMVEQELALGLLAVLPGIDMGLRVRFGCAWLKTRTVSPVATRFKDLLAEHVSDVCTHAVLTPANINPAKRRV